MQHPEVEARLLQEAHDVLMTSSAEHGSRPHDTSASTGCQGEDNQHTNLPVHPTYEQLKQLKYARAVFWEGLRLFPSVPQVSQNADMITFKAPKNANEAT